MDVDVIEGRDPAETEEGVQFFRLDNTLERVMIVVDGYEVPYLEAWKTNLPDGQIYYHISLDNRFGISGTEAEIKKWIRFIANAMAVSAGRTSHGPNSRLINRHGESGP